MMLTAGPHGTAWRLLEELSLLEPDDEDAVARARGLVETGVDPDELVALAMRHNLLPALAEFLVGHELDSTLPAGMRSHLKGTWQWCRQRALVQVGEAARVVDAVEAHGVRVACTKGIVVQSTLYRRRGIRYLADIDLMIRPQDQEPVREAMAELGYPWARRVGPGQDALVPIARAKLAVYRLYPDHLPHFRRLTGDGVVPVSTVDVAFDLTWYGSRWTVPMADVLHTLERIEVAEGVRLPTLLPTYGFLFLALHLFREAWYERFVRTRDVRLTQFADLTRAWRSLSTADRHEVRELVRRYGLERPLAWVAGHTDGVYATSLTDELGVRGAADADWLATAGGNGDAPLRWAGDMRSRLAGSRPPEFVPQEHRPQDRRPATGRTGR